MIRKLTGFFLASALLLPAASFAGDEYTDQDSHPLKVVSTLIHPVGVGLEYLVFRPLHFVTSRPGVDKVFGHQSDEERAAQYQPLNP